MITLIVLKDGRAYSPYNKDLEAILNTDDGELESMVHEMKILSVTRNVWWSAFQGDTKKLESLLASKGIQYKMDKR